MRRLLQALEQSLRHDQQTAYFDVHRLSWQGLPSPSALGGNGQTPLL